MVDGLISGAFTEDFNISFKACKRAFASVVGVWLGGVGVNDEGEFAGEVVNHRQFFALQQQDIGAVQLVGRAGFLQLFLDVAHSVVPKITRQTTTKTRHAGLQGNFEALLVLGDEVQRVDAAGFNDDAIGDDFGFRICAKAAGPQQSASWQADKAVATKALATHDGFKQKTVVAGVFIACRAIIFYSILS